jgi:hypothetical protein
MENAGQIGLESDEQGIASTVKVMRVTPYS